MIEVLEDRCVPAAQFTSVSSAVMKDGTLQVLFKESGINTTIARTEELTGTATVSYQWSTKGGKTPQGPVFASPTVQMDVKSQWISTTSGYFYVAPPPPTSDFLAYPHSSTWVAIVTVSYTNLVVTDVTFGDSSAIPNATGTGIANL